MIQTIYQPNVKQWKHTYKTLLKRPIKDETKGVDRFKVIHGDFT